MAMATASPAKSVAIVTTSPWRATAQGGCGGDKGRMVWEEVMGMETFVIRSQNAQPSMNRQRMHWHWC
jgi:hypothetical protein